MTDDIVEKRPDLENTFSRSETDAERALREDVPMLEFMFIDLFRDTSMQIL